MVCNRCIMAVQTIFEQHQITVTEVNMGEVMLQTKLADQQKQDLEKSLTTLGFELICDRKSRIIEQIKAVIIDLIQNQNGELLQNLSDVLREKLQQDYNYLSRLFSDVEGITIEKYFISQKIEKVKELLVYDELNLSEIAYRLNYSSVAYLSSQFKKITGLTPSHFKKIGSRRRKPLDQV